MHLFSQSSETPRITGQRAKPLARHIFVRVAFPVGIVFLSCFSLLDRLVQNQLRQHIKQETLSWDTKAYRASLNDAAGLSRSLTALADAAGVPQALQRTAAAGSFVDPLQRLAASLDEDVYAVFDADKRPIVTLRRDTKALIRAVENPTVSETRRLAQLDGEHYFLTSYPLLKDGRPVGWMVVGRRWLREMAIDDGWYLLAKNGKVVEHAGMRAQTGFEAGTAMPFCVEMDAACDLDIHGRPHVLLRSASSGKGQEIEIFLVRSLDLMTSPLLGMTRGIMLMGAFLSILGALGLAVLTGRAISSPLKNITDSCVRAQGTGHLSEIEIPPSRIEEVNALGLTLQSAVRSIEVGQTQLSQAYFQFMGAIVALLDARDAYTAGHSHRVSAYSEALARDFGLPQRQIDDIRVGALLHDIGKIGVPDEVLRKHERLTKEEFELMKQHPAIGRKVLEQVVQFSRYLDAVELHHENLDGTGYPRGLRGEEIPISARIVKVADVYDALSTDRPYRKRMLPVEVHKILRDGSGKHFDRLLVEIFLTRSLPSFEHRSGLEQLHFAIGEPSPAPARSAMGV
jgi:putative nucleotidyltransferase with HDIG domain